MTDVSSVSQAQHRDLYRMMLRIRKIEEKLADLYPEQEIRCPVHLSIGQEAVAAGICAALRIGDHIYSTHRCHAHYLAKGGELKSMVAELYGKRTGSARGKGGSMHLVDPSVGMMGASAIVGGTIPMAVGSALAFQMRRTDQVAVAFFGDGAVEQGAFHESLNFASLRNLPVVFVCENNFYATHSHLSARQPDDNIYQRAEVYCMPGVRVDGNDVLEVYFAARTAVSRARKEEGPTLIECRTYRWREHVGPGFDLSLGYRSKEELDAWRARCPLKGYEAVLRESGVLSGNELYEIGRRVDEEVSDAIEFAKASPSPEEAELAEDVY